MKKAFILCLLCLVLLGCGGCGRSARSPRYFAYLDRSARASISGNINGLSFTALLQSEGRSTQTGDVASGAPSFTLTYLSPAALAGVKVRYDAVGDQYVLSLEDLDAQGDRYAGLGEVGLMLLHESAVQSTREDRLSTPDSNGEQRRVVVLNTLDGAIRTHDAQTGLPLHVTWSAGGRSIELDVQEWLVP